MAQSTGIELSLTDLRKSFGTRVALDGVTFSVKPGEIFGFVGSNGAGKTTTMRGILGVMSLDSGSIDFGGEPITREVRANIGYMPEERGLYPKMKIGEQLIYLARLHGLSKPEATEAMLHWTERLGIAERRNDLVEALSLGNQQRVQLVAALSHSPKLLILDEPFSGLDPLAVEAMRSTLREMADAGVPVVFSSHQLDLVESISDRVGIIASGKMVAVGTIDELQANAPIRYSILSGTPLPEDWLTAKGAHEIERGNNRVVVELDKGIDPSTILKNAMKAAPVTEFTKVRAKLSELYKEVVSV